MTQKRKSRKEYRQLDGILLLDKPKGVTSNAILQKMRHLFEAQKAGHSGTLDPMATGLLPICFGEAAKFSGQLLNNFKSYQFTCQLGIATTTGDAEGEIKEQTEIPKLTEEALEETFQHFLGESTQIPPMVSALHHKGRRLYELAREGIEVERPPRKIFIKSLKLDAFDHGSFTATALVSKGTYIRVLAEDIAKSLGTLGHLRALRRLTIEPFEQPKMITPEILLPLEGDFEALDKHLLPVDAALCDLPALTLTKEGAERVKMGQKVPQEEPLEAPLYRLYDCKGAFIGVGEPFHQRSIGAKRLIKTN